MGGLYGDDCCLYSPCEEDCKEMTAVHTVTVSRDCMEMTATIRSL